MVTYESLAELSAEQLSNYMLNRICSINLDPNIDAATVEGANYLSTKLMEVSALFMEFSSILAIVVPKKRAAKRNGDNELYQDYIDKESVVEDLLKALDTRYKAINRCLTVRETNMKELYMSTPYV